MTNGTPTSVTECITLAGYPTISTAWEFGPNRLPLADCHIQNPAPLNKSPSVIRTSGPNGPATPGQDVAEREYIGGWEYHGKRHGLLRFGEGCLHERLMVGHGTLLYQTDYPIMPYFSRL